MGAADGVTFITVGRGAKQSRAQGVSIALGKQLGHTGTILGRRIAMSPQPGRLEN